MPWLRYVAIAALFVWLNVDGMVVFRRASKKTENRDRASIFVLMAGNMLSIAAAIWLALMAYGAIHPALPAQIAGLVVMALGITLRFVAIAQLGRFHTPNVAVLTNHEVFQRGLYHYVRHPSYLGALIAFTGFGLALGSWYSLAVMVVVSVFVYLFRIREEEAALHAALGERYADYCRRTKRLIPGLY